MSQEKKYDVFISYSRKDEKVAYEIYDYLTTHGVNCWIDKYSIEPGEAYAAAIEKGVLSANNLVVLYSENVLDSTNVLSELELAHNNHKRIISFRLDDAPMRKGYAFYLSLPQWINAIPKVSDALPLLLAAVKSQTCSVQQYARAAVEKRRKKRRIAVIASSLLGATILLAIGLYYSKSSDTTQSLSTVQPTINLDSINRANQAEIERLRQDSIARALQAEADRLAQERARLDEQAQKAEEQRKAEAAKPKATATTAPKATTTTTSTTTTTKVETPAKVDPLAAVQAKADAGDAAACYQVALAYKNGEGVAKNLSTAFQYMKSAAEKGYTPAYIEVAKMYHGGRGVTKDRDVAEQWYQKAADAGNAEARRILLNM